MKDSIRLSDHFTYTRLMRFVVPSVIMMVFTSVYGMIDGLFVSNYAGKIPFAAVNLMWPFIMLLSAPGFMFGSGGSAVVAKALGEGDKKRANEYFTMIVFGAAATGIILSVLGFIFVPVIAGAVGAEGRTYECCVVYGRILFSFLWAFTLQNVFQSLFVTAEKPKLGLAVAIGAGAANILGDYILVGVFKGGVLGAGTATGLSQLVGGGLPLIYFAVRNKSRFRFVKVKLNMRLLFKVCLNGCSELMTNISLSIVNILYNFQLMRLIGDDGIAAYGVIMYVNFVFISAFLGYSVGTAPIVSYQYGAARTQELKNVFKKSIIIIALCGVVMTTLAVNFAGVISGIFVGYDQGLKALTKEGFSLFGFSYLFSGIGIYSSAFFTALENGFISAFLSFLRTFLFQAAAVIILPVILGSGGIWLAVVAAEMAACTVSICVFIAERKRYMYI